MIDVAKIRGLMAEKGYTIRSLSKAMGISEITLSNKLKRGIFNSDEMMQLVELLNMINPSAVFLKNKLRATQPKRHGRSIA